MATTIENALAGSSMAGAQPRFQAMSLWLIGISGAGKTTLGKRLRAFFQENGRSVFMIDGDEARAFFGHDLGYTREDRKANIKRIIYGAYLLTANGIDTIVCNISPFEELRELARAKIPEYNEIHLKKDLKQSWQSDHKNVYRQALGQSELVGIDIEFEAPRRSDLLVEVDKQSVDESFHHVIGYLAGKYPATLPGTPPNWTG